VRSRAPGLLFVTATAGIADVNGPDSDVADVSLTAAVDGAQTPGQSSTQIAQGRSATVPFQSSARVSKGRHTVTLQINATNYDGDLRASPVSLHAVIVPPASK
jgi:Tfp pilus assembly protein PilW